jgi:hypothetical protein
LKWQRKSAAVTLRLQWLCSFKIRRYSQRMWLKIRRDFDEIKRYLIRHEQLLANLPEAIREKIAFKQ